MEEALHQVNVKLGFMNSVTRHDMLNQMVVLKGFLDLSSQIEKDRALVQYINKMNQAANNC